MAHDQAYRGWCRSYACKRVPNMKRNRIHFKLTSIEENIRQRQASRNSRLHLVYLTPGHELNRLFTGETGGSAVNYVR
jgi:hypothetical protein